MVTQVTKDDYERNGVILYFWSEYGEFKRCCDSYESVSHVVELYESQEGLFKGAHLLGVSGNVKWIEGHFEQKQQCIG